MVTGTVILMLGPGLRHLMVNGKEKSSNTKLQGGVELTGQHKSLAASEVEEN